MTPQPGTEARSLDIVVADDVEGIRELIGQWLEDLGHGVRRAENGREVIKLVSSRPCDLVVTDILMPDGDGLDVIMDVKRTRPATRILAFSGGGRFMGVADALRLAKAIGADGMLLKPFNRDQFLGAVEQVMPGAWRARRRE